jgi:TonB family protein
MIARTCVAVALAGLAVTLPLAVSAQTPPKSGFHPVTESFALERLIQTNPIEYPAIARAAEVQGVVTLLVVVNVDGQVEFVEVQKGHPMLDVAATAAVRSRRFRPLEIDGTPTRAVTSQSVVFALTGNLPSLVAAAIEVSSYSTRCETLAHAGQLDEASAACRQGAAAIATLPQILSSSSRVMLDLAHGTLALKMSNAAAAVNYLTNVVESVGRYTGYAAPRARAWRQLSQAHAALGDLRTATAMCGRAEREMGQGRSAARRIAGLFEARTTALRETLLECAAIHAKAGKTGDERSARKRAAELDSTR